MSDRWRDQRYLVTQQYQSGLNLNARIRLHQLFSTNTYDWFLWVFDHFDFPAHPRILEIGCGTGLLWLKNLHRLPVDWSIDLVDLSHGMLMEAQRSLNDAGQFTFSVMDAQNLNFSNSTFDAVVANHMLYHVPNLPRTLQEIQRVLKPGGKVFAATNGVDHLAEIFQLADSLPVAELIPSFKKGYAKPTRQFSLENGTDLLQPYFSAISLFRYIDSLRVTEAKPLSDYLLSLFADQLPRREYFPMINAAVEQAIANSPDRILHITKSTGLFFATK